MSDSDKKELGPVRKFVRDNWTNVLKGFGSARDSNMSNTFGSFTILSDFQLASMYAGDGWQKKVASIPAGSMVREWISIADDPDNKIDNMLTMIDTKNCFKQAIVWQRVFRGGLVWMVSTKPKNYTYKKGEKVDIKKLLVFSASEVRVHEIYGTEDVITAGSNKKTTKIDPLKIGEVQSFRILKNRKRKEDIIVDASQCLVFKGDPIPSAPEESFDTVFSGTNIDQLEYEYWGMGALQSIYPQMSKYGMFESGMGKIATELVVAIYKIAGLREILQADGGQAMIQNRIETIDVSKSMINAMFLDADGNEDFFRNSINLAGVPDLWDRFMMTVSGVTNIPSSKLFGRQAAGMNNKGEQDERNYNDYIVDLQGMDMKRNLMILISHLTGKEVSFSFNNPWAPSQSELVDMRQKQSEIDKVYLETGVLTPDEVRTSRFDDMYSFETGLLQEEAPDIQEGDEDLPPEPGSKDPDINDPDM